MLLYTLVTVLTLKNSNFDRYAVPKGFKQPTPDHYSITSHVKLNARIREYMRYILPQHEYINI